MWSYDIPAGYRMVEHLGEHRGSAVWRAEDLEQGRAVALVFVEPFGWEPKRVSRFLRVIGQLSLLAHPNVVGVLDSGKTEAGRGYAAFELLKGNTLEQLIEHSQTITLHSLMEIAVEVLDGLAVLHDGSLVHGDIEPDNLFLTLEGDRVRPKLIGLGHGRAVERAVGRSEPEEGAEDSDQSGEGVPKKVGDAEVGPVGGIGKEAADELEGLDEIDEADRQGYLRSLAFSSPEQAKGMVSIGARSDLYSLAAVLYEMISGRLPHPGTTETELRTAVRNGDALPLESICQKVPLSLSKAIQKAMAFYLSARTSDARTMQQELAEALREIPDSIRAEPLPLLSERTDGPDAISAALEIQTGVTGRTLRIEESDVSTPSESGAKPQGRKGSGGIETDEDVLFGSVSDSTDEYSGEVESSQVAVDDARHPRPKGVIDGGVTPRDDDTEVSAPPTLEGVIDVAPLDEYSLLEMEPTTHYDRRASGLPAGGRPPGGGTKTRKWRLLLIFAGAVMFSMIVGGLIAVVQIGSTSTHDGALPSSSIVASHGSEDADTESLDTETVAHDVRPAGEVDEAPQEDMVFDASALIDGDAIFEVEVGPGQPLSEVRWTLVGLPEGAVIRLDEVEVDGPVIEVEPDGQIHTIEIEVPGFALWSRRHTPQRDMEISVSMRRTRRSGRSKTVETPPEPRQPTKIEAEVVRNPGF